MSVIDFEQQVADRISSEDAAALADISQRLNVIIAQLAGMNESLVQLQESRNGLSERTYVASREIYYHVLDLWLSLGGKLSGEPPEAYKELRRLREEFLP